MNFQGNKLTTIANRALKVGAVATGIGAAALGFGQQATAHADAPYNGFYNNGQGTMWRWDCQSPAQPFMYYSCYVGAFPAPPDANPADYPVWGSNDPNVVKDISPAQLSNILRSGGIDPGF